MDFLNKDGNLVEGLLDLLFDENMMENLDDFPTVEKDFNVLTQAPSTTPSNRFKAVSAEDVENFLETNQNKNTKRKTTGDINLFQSFLQSKGKHRNLEFIPPDLLNQYLSEFLLSVTKKDGSEYEPTTLRGLMGSVDRHLRSKNYQYSVMSSIEFARSRQVLKTKQKHLKSLGKGNKSKAADPLDEELIEKFHECGILGNTNPESLIYSMWMICTLHFGMRTGQEAYNLRWGDIQLKEDSLGEYLIYDTERQTKTRNGTNVIRGN
ncbi:uncharacterized protein LOC128550578 [Mercenaria mercenaria]|uniref:uncharacterized protein LOC128550578 n=1 Tax=Mercenaria mercenaria TaxID=6596 RepID=UPI00234E8AA9|nr:uncharacterized protein LOC128550578 [Mercenaria mercenaria]